MLSRPGVMFAVEHSVQALSRLTESKNLDMARSLITSPSLVVNLIESVVHVNRKAGHVLYTICYLASNGAHSFGY